jgi:hypothetical protein
MEIKEAKAYLTKEMADVLKPLREKGIHIISCRGKFVSVSMDQGVTQLNTGYEVEVLFEGTITRDCHFERGRWVDQFTPFLETLLGSAKPDNYIERFEVTMNVREYTFKNGAAVGLVEKKVPMGIFTMKEIRERRYCTPYERTMPECDGCKGPG